MAESTESGTDSISLKQLGSTLSGLANPECDLCPLHQDTDRVCIPVNLPTRRLTKDGKQVRMLIVGEAPGFNEAETGRLFSGPAGQLLDKALGEVNLKREWFFVTNSVKCRPEENRTPTPAEIRVCSASYLSKELAAIQPQYGLMLGNAGCQAILGKKGITKFNGQTFDKYGVKWVAALHPAAVLRNPRYRKPFMGALLIFARLLRDEEGTPVTETKLVNDKESLKELLSVLELAEIAAIDVETWSSHPPVGRFKGGGLAWWHYDFRITTINFSVKQGYAYVLPLWHDQARWKDPDKVVQIIKPYVEGIPQRIMHNGKYDTKCLWQIGIDAPHTFDTMGAEYAQDENNIKDLGFLSMVYLGAPEYKEMVNKANTKSEDLDLLAEYGGKDADYTLRLHTVAGRKLKGQFLAKRLYDSLLHPSDLVLAHVEARGMPLDLPLLDSRTTECRQMIYRTEQEVFATVGWEFNLNSPTQVAEVLFHRMGFPVLELTSSKKPSTREGVLIRLRTLDDTDLIDKILEYRKWKGYESRYLNPWPILMDHQGILHPNFKPYHTVTGRLSCENPNMQQVPRDVFIRGIIGGVPGWTVLEADYSQAEMRLAAHYSQDKNLMRVFNSGRDVHMEMAMAITGLSEDEVSSEQRKMAKAVNFGFLYGMGWKKFITYAKENYELDVGEVEAQRVRKEFFATNRQLPRWHDRQRKKAQMHGFVMSSIGRKRHLHDIHSSNQEVRAEAERQAINSPVQSLASDMMLFAMIQLEQILPPDEAYLVSTVHDSILFMVRDDVVDKWAPVIKEVMETLPLEETFECLLTVPIVADVKYGSHWSEGAVAF